METDTDDPTAGDTGDDDIPAWVARAVLGGLIGLFAGRVVGNQDIEMCAATLLFVGTVSYLAHGGKWIGTWGKREKRSPDAAPAQAAPIGETLPGPPYGLVGSRISNGAAVFTVLDDSTVTGNGRRSTLIAADERGNVGLLFVGLDAAGRVTEARVADGEWTTAAVVG